MISGMHVLCETDTSVSAFDVIGTEAEASGDSESVSLRTRHAHTSDHARKYGVNQLRCGGLTVTHTRAHTHKVNSHKGIILLLDVPTYCSAQTTATGGTLFEPWSTRIFDLSILP